MKIESAPPSATSRQPDAGPPASASAQNPEAQRPVAANGVEQHTGTITAPVPGLKRPAPFARSTKRLVLIGLIILVLLFLARVGGLLHPFLWAIVVSYVLTPLVGAICARTGLRRGLVVVLVYLALLGTLGLVLALAVPRLSDQVSQLARDLPTLLNDFEVRYLGYTNQPLSFGPFNIDVATVTRQLSHSLNGSLDSIYGGTFGAIKTAATVLTDLALFLIVTFYLLLDAPNIARYATNALPPVYKDELLDLAREVDGRMRFYVRAQLLLIAIMSCAALIVLTVMGVRFAIVLAPLVGILEIFPVIGPFSAIAMVTIVALLSPANFGLTSSTSALIVAVVFFILREIEDYAVIPNVVGHAVQLHPALILFVVAAGASLGGPLGLFVAVPLTGALRVVGVYLYQKLELDAPRS